MRLTLAAVVAAAGIASGCASGPTPPAYPAFVQVDALSDQFLASLPGIRAKQFAGNEETRSAGYRIDLPRDWQGTTGGAPGHSLELFVLAGSLHLADIELGPGGYVYVPPGSLGFNVETDAGARVLWFNDAVAPEAMIRTPIILDSGLVEWQPGSVAGTAERELRRDPGSGARTWLVRVEPGAELPFESASTAREGYLVEGRFRETECVAGEPYTAVYAAGGYFDRPPFAVHGGPAAGALSPAVWLLRQQEHAARTSHPGCPAAR